MVAAAQGGRRPAGDTGGRARGRVRRHGRTLDSRREQRGGRPRTRQSRERGEAQRLAGTEAQARDLAQAHEKTASDRAESLAAQDYISRVDRAYREIQDGNKALAEDLLHGCPPARRGWEWHYVKRLCNLERLSLEAGESTSALAFSPDGTWVVSGSGPADHRGRASRVGRGGRRPLGRGVRPAAADLPRVQRVRLHRGRQPRRKPGRGRQWVFEPDGRGPRVGVGREDRSSRMEPERAGSRGDECRLQPRRQVPRRRVRILLRRRRRQGQGLGRRDRTGDGGIRRPERGRHQGRLPPRRQPARRRRFGGRRGLGPRRQDQSARPQGPLPLGLRRRLQPRRQMAGHRRRGTGPSSSGTPDTGSERLTIFAHDGYTLDLAFSPDGRHLATTSEDRSVKLWEVPSGRNVATFRGHTDFVQAVAFRPDGREIASGGMEGTVKFWDLRTSRQVVFDGHTGWVERLAFRRDGRRVLSEAGLRRRMMRPTKGWDPLTGELDPGLTVASFDQLPADFLPRPIS